MSYFDFTWCYDQYPNFFPFIDEDGIYKKTLNGNSELIQHIPYSNANGSGIGTWILNKTLLKWLNANVSQYTIIEFDRFYIRNLRGGIKKPSYTAVVGVSFKNTSDAIKYKLRFE